MPAVIHPAKLRALRIAPRARAALRTGSTWRLLSSHKHALNFIDPIGTLLSLTQDRIRMGPFSVEVESIPAGPTFDELVERIPIVMDAEARVRLGDLTLDLTPATNWDPRPRWPRLVAIPWQSDFLPVLLNRLRVSAPPESLACIVQDQGLRAMRHRGQGIDDRSRDAGRLQGLPQSAATELAILLGREVAAGNDQGAASAAAALAGMGSGLTPSGDDFLIGMMFGMWSALSATDATAMTQVLHRASAERTNRISRAWLSAAAEVEASQAWHDLVESIVSTDRRRIEQACTDLIDMGHTSGADALAGFIAFHLARGSYSTI
jgi:hypothetical protein